MNSEFKMDPMLQIFISETLKQLEDLEQAVLNIEKESQVSESIKEIFRLMHSIKGSASMMLFNNIASLAHSIEDLFDYIRSNPEQKFDYSSIVDIVLAGIDFIKNEVLKIQNELQADGDCSEQVNYIKEYLKTLKVGNSGAEPEISVAPEKNSDERPRYYIPSEKKLTVDEEEKETNYEALIFFEEDCGMENVRAFAVVHELSDIASQIVSHPEDLIDSDKSLEIIVNEGLRLWFKSSKSEETIKKYISDTGFLREFQLNVTEERIEDKKQNKVILLDEKEEARVQKNENNEHLVKEASLTKKQESINVNIMKLDKLMDLVGELVISESMVTRNPELEGVPLDNFYKASRQLRKITNDIQDIVTSIRMVPLALTFQKMNRLVRDMSRQLKKEIDLEIVGETTEVDKNIIEHLSDPLMHIIRNCIDHGIESPEDRKLKGKDKKGKIVLEGKNAGGDVWIIVKDDGKGLDKKRILEKARTNKLITKPENELTDKEIYSFIFLPGFSTKENVTEFSGRGVGLDVVMKNIEKIRGTVQIDSTTDIGTTIIIKIPLTLAIINGMTVRVGESTYTVPTTSIKESFRIKENELILDPDGNEMILVRGECYPIIRLNEMYKVPSQVKKMEDGIIMMIENDSKSICIFADELLGEQQVVVKALPKYIKKVKGIAGCTLLGNGSISLILDAGELINQM